MPPLGHSDLLDKDPSGVSTGYTSTTIVFDMAAPRTCEARHKTRALLVGGTRLTSSGSHQPLNQKHDGQRKHGTTDEKEKHDSKSVGRTLA